MTTSPNPMAAIEQLVGETRSPVAPFADDRGADAAANALNRASSGPGGTGRDTPIIDR